MLAGAELPGAVPRQAAAPGHGAGSHLGADWTPHLPITAPIACHQVTQGQLKARFPDSRPVTQLRQQAFELCMRAVGSDPCSGIATCMSELVLQHIAPCMASCSSLH